MICSPQTNTSLSAYAKIHGFIYFNVTNLSPPGTKSRSKKFISLQLFINACGWWLVHWTIHLPLPILPLLHSIHIIHNKYRHHKILPKNNSLPVHQHWWLPSTSSRRHHHNHIQQKISSPTLIFGPPLPNAYMQVVQILQRAEKPPPPPLPIPQPPHKSTPSWTSEGAKKDWPDTYEGEPLLDMQHNKPEMHHISNCTIRN